MLPSNEHQKITCIACALKEKLLANPQPNQQPHKKNNQRICDVQDQEDALELLVMNIQKVVVKVVLEEEAAEEEASTKVQATGSRTEEDHLALVDGEIVPQVLVKEKDFLNLLDRPI